MPFLVDAIANRFLDIAENEGKRLSPMKLQKLIYFAHGWHLGITETPLIDEPIELWSYGPVVSSLYQEFKDIGDGEIQRKATELRRRPGGEKLEYDLYEPSIEDCAASKEQKEIATTIVDQVWQRYNRFTALELSAMTHQKDTPWEILYRKFNGRIPAHLRIPNDLILQHFRARLLAAQSKTAAAS